MVSERFYVKSEKRCAVSDIFQETQQIWKALLQYGYLYDNN